ncbi:sulfatase family protein [Rufibacter quisquiliarum]|uniref:Arylsulfatase A-like enzyme n=1 Tax=Rufibacter quisquiliarum TaxID=1549639 RepID=A0A839GP97_9BACT|nr:sulfatase [Rufibacter quisquiliarum]MBA9078619.1 arylsulfatase A-like enzyme [Rufibacter quisquiliarum]
MIRERVRRKPAAVLLALLVLVNAGCQTTKTEQANTVKPSAQPNIVIIMADDLASSELSCYGGKNLTTHHIDALAKEGMQFNNMYASEAMCVPIRASLFTGLYPAKHGSYQNHKGVHENLKSVGHYLGNADYRVGLTGKDHSTKPATVFPFEIIDGFEKNCVAKTADYTVDGIRNFVTGSKKPFCLFVMSTNPHAPWTVGDPNEFDPEKLVLPAHWVDTKQTRQHFARYLAEVRQLDKEVGDVMKMLKETGQDKNTMVIFLGEQGPQFPGGKWNLWDHGVKSAMIVRHPGHVKPNTKTNAVTQYEDITPTLVALAGGKEVPGLDGSSFLPVLGGKAQKHRQYAYGIHNNIPEGPAYPIRAITDGRYKLILNLTPEANYHIKYMMNPGAANPTWRTWQEVAKQNPAAKVLTDRIVHRPAVEFYDTQQDPAELKNLAKDPAHAEKVNTMTAALRQWMQQQGDTGADFDKEFARHD